MNARELWRRTCFAPAVTFLATVRLARGMLATRMLATSMLATSMLATSMLATRMLTTRILATSMLAIVVLALTVAGASQAAPGEVPGQGGSLPAGPVPSALPEARMAELAEAAYLPPTLIPRALAGRDLDSVLVLDRSPDQARTKLPRPGGTALAFCARARGERSSLPRGTLVIVFRGTKTPTDVLTDAHFQLTKWATGVCWQAGKVHSGFLSVARLAFDSPEVMSRVWSARTICIGGHSLGGAAALVFAGLLLDRGVPARRLRVFTFGAPRPGDAAFADAFHHVLQLTQCVKGRDPVSLVPPRPYYHMYERPDVGYGLITFPGEPADVVRCAAGVNHEDHHSWHYVAALKGYDEDIQALKRSAAVPDPEADPADDPGATPGTDLEAEARRALRPPGARVGQALSSFWRWATQPVSFAH